MQHETHEVYNSWGRHIQIWVKIGAVSNGSSKPHSCQKQKDNYILSLPISFSNGDRSILDENKLHPVSKMQS